MPRNMYGPRMTFIGAFLGTPVASTLDWYVENNRTTTWPIDLYGNQVAQRLKPPVVTGLSGPGYGCDPASGNPCCIGYSNVSCPQCPSVYGGKQGGHEDKYCWCALAARVCLCCFCHQ